MPREVDEEGRKNDRGVGEREGKERRPDEPLALSQTVATGPETNLDQELREGRQQSYSYARPLSPSSSRILFLLLRSFIPLFLPALLLPLLIYRRLRA